MAESLIISPNLSRTERYAELLPQVESVLAGETDLIANLANTAAMLREAFGFFWVGFYLHTDGELVLGPFQGPLACTRIALGKGVCGAAAVQQSTLIVPDVDQFPGHIACSSLSRSEIVVPLVAGGRTELVLDVDSTELNDFSSADAEGLEAIIRILRMIHWPQA
ncbi:MAG: GAF domain-containing protein [Bacteroidia bacterium]|nr:GAF domain-containing protein [Bacteroidia bacterium]